MFEAKRSQSNCDKNYGSPDREKRRVPVLLQVPFVSRIQPRSDIADASEGMDSLECWQLGRRTRQGGLSMAADIIERSFGVYRGANGSICPVGLTASLADLVAALSPGRTLDRL
jgi:hypothetical protein